MYIRVDQMERELSKALEEAKIDINNINQKCNDEKQKSQKVDIELKMLDNKITKVVGNVNHSRETFLELKSQLYKEISMMKQDFFSQVHELSEEHRETKSSQDTCTSQLENHKLLLNDLDSIIEKINLDMTHKFNMTIKTLQEEKLDKREFNSRIAFIQKVIQEVGEDANSLKKNDSRMQADVYKLVHANTQLELYGMMNWVFKDGSEEKESLREYLKGNFGSLTKSKKVIKKVIVKEKVDKDQQKTDTLDTEKLDVLGSQRSEESEYIEKEIDQEFDQELNFNEITQELTQKFEYIKSCHFDLKNEKVVKREEQRKIEQNKYRIENDKQKKQDIVNIFTNVMSDKYGHLLSIRDTVDSIKGDQQRTSKKIAEVGQKFKEFKGKVKTSFSNQFESLRSRISSLEDPNVGDKKTGISIDKDRNRFYSINENDSEATSIMGWDSRSVLGNFDEHQITQLQDMMLKSNSLQNEISPGITEDEMHEEIEKSCENLEEKLMAVLNQKTFELKSSISTTDEILIKMGERLNKLAETVENNRELSDTSDLELQQLCALQANSIDALEQLFESFVKR